MSCGKECNDCLECELCQRVPLLIVDDRSFMEKRYEVSGFKCIWDIRYDLDTKRMRLGGFKDDILYISQHKILVDYINQYFSVSI